MQTAAAQVDNDLAQGYRQLGQAAPAVRGRLLVGVDGDAHAERLVRHASRVAQRRHLPWSLVHVDNGTVRDEQSRLRLQNAQQLAERLGGEVVLLRAGEVAKTLIQHAAERRASLLLVGQSRPSLRRRLFGGGLAARLLRQAHGLEINVLDNDHEHPQPRLRATPTLVWFDYLLALVATLLASALAWAVSSILPLPNISLVFLAAVLLVAVRSSLGRRWPVQRYRF
ncbi:universal stress protein [Pseudomonas parakoreensis]